MPLPTPYTSPRPACTRTCSPFNSAVTDASSHFAKCLGSCLIGNGTSAPTKVVRSWPLSPDGALTLFIAAPLDTCTQHPPTHQRTFKSPHASSGLLSLSGKMLDWKIAGCQQYLHVSRRVDSMSSPRTVQTVEGQATQSHWPGSTFKRRTSYDKSTSRLPLPRLLNGSRTRVHVDCIKDRRVPHGLDGQCDGRDRVKVLRRSHNASLWVPRCSNPCEARAHGVDRCCRAGRTRQRDLSLRTRSRRDHTHVCHPSR